MKAIPTTNNDIYTIIHTVQIVTPYKACYENITATDYNRKPLFKNDAMWLIINPNNYPQKCSDGIRDLQTFKAMLSAILDKYNITEYTLKRVDVAINMTLDYEDCYKLNAYLSNLDCTRAGAKNHFYSNDFKMNHRNLIVKQGHYVSEFYNKKIESNGCNYAKTRLEFRYINIDVLSFEYAIDRTIKNLNQVLNSRVINEVNERLIEDISAQYAKEREKRAIKSFTEFICKYSTFIFNKRILYGVYHRCMKGTATSWFAKYKQSRNIEFIYKRDLINYTAMLKESLRKYLN